MRSRARRNVGRRAVAPLAVAWLALGLAACAPEGEQPERADEELAEAWEPAAADSPRDVETEPATQGAETPGSEEVWAEDEPTEAMITVAAGTEITVQLDQELSTDENEAGDEFTATVTQPVAEGGRELIPAGAQVRGAVTAVQKPEESQEDAAVIKLDITEIEVRDEAHPVQASVVEVNPEMESETTTGEAAAKVGAGAAAGAIVGRIIGGDARGTLIGAAVGAAAGTAIVLGTGDEKAVLPEGSLMTIRLDEPLHLPAEEAAVE